RAFAREVDRLPGTGRRRFREAPGAPLTPARRFREAPRATATRPRPFREGPRPPWAPTRRFGNASRAPRTVAWRFREPLRRPWAPTCARWWGLPGPGARDLGRREVVGAGELALVLREQVGRGLAPVVAGHVGGDAAADVLHRVARALEVVAVERAVEVGQ